jgi:hypothetical protein
VKVATVCPLEIEISNSSDLIAKLIRLAIRNSSQFHKDERRIRKTIATLSRVWKTIRHLYNILGV